MGARKRHPYAALAMAQALFNGHAWMEHPSITIFNRVSQPFNREIRRRERGRKGGIS
jgi:hypothetical protein